MGARLYICGLFCALTGCVLQIVPDTAPDAGGNCDVACNAPMVCVSTPDCLPHCGCNDDSNCASDQFCSPTADCGGTCYGKGPCPPSCPANLCGVNGNCCAAACPSVQGEFCATYIGCDDAGACLYPPLGIDCGTTCTNDLQTDHVCNGAGSCVPGPTIPCPNNASCGPNACNGPCGSDGGCAVGYVCNGAGNCLPP